MSVKFGIKTTCVALALVFVTGQMHAVANEKPISFEADNVVVNQGDGSLIATGNVVLEQAGSTLRADEVTYYQQTDRAVARGDVTHTDADGTVSLAKFMELKTEFNKVQW